MIELTNPSNLPDPSEIDYMEEPVVEAEIMVTTRITSGPIMDLCQERRGTYISMEYMEETRALIKYDAAAERDYLRLLRRAEVPLPGVRLLRL